RKCSSHDRLSLWSRLRRAAPRGVRSPRPLLSADRERSSEKRGRPRKGQRRSRLESGASSPRMTGIAVVIPCRNLGRTVEEAVESVLRQTRLAAEVVVVDDGSDDPYTRQVLCRLEIGGTHVARIPHRGVAGARNLGVALTSAPFIVLLDADDVLEPSYLER